MPKFAYVSRDSNGQKVTAVAEAQTRQAAGGQSLGGQSLGGLASPAA